MADSKYILRLFQHENYARKIIIMNMITELTGKQFSRPQFIASIPLYSYQTFFSRCGDMKYLSRLAEKVSTTSYGLHRVRELVKNV